MQRHSGIHRIWLESGKKQNPLRSVVLTPLLFVALVAALAWSMVLQQQAHDDNLKGACEDIPAQLRSLNIGSLKSCAQR